MNKNLALLTGKQKDFYDTLKSYITKHKEAPTIGELMAIKKLSSPRAVTQYLEALERRGLIARERYGKRGIRLLDPSETGGAETITIPVIAAAGCDQMSIIANRNFTDFICIDKEMLQGKKRDQVVSVRAIGDSMVDAGVSDGDYVLVEITESVFEGDLVVAIVDSFAVIKKMELANNAIILKPVSPDPQYKPIILRRDFKIFGKVIDVIRKPAKGELEVVPIYS